LVFRHPQRQQKKQTCLQLSALDDVGLALYDTQLWASGLVDSQLTSATPTSLVLLYAAGLLTAFSPCSISLLPLTLAYLGGADNSANVSEPSSNASKLLVKSGSYAAGLATTLASLGLAAAFLGQVFGASGVSNLLGDFPGLATALFSLFMGLNLLQLVQFSFPSFVASSSLGKEESGLRQAFLLGGSSALIASPCSSPVLASLLAFVANSGNPSLGALFLFTFSLGYATPVVLAGALSGSANTLFSSRGAPWVNNALASFLIAFGTYSSLDSLSKILLT